MIYPISKITLSQSEIFRMANLDVGKNRLIQGKPTIIAMIYTPLTRGRLLINLNQFIRKICDI
jgi:hypothetical protein